MDILLPADRIQQRIAEMARQIALTHHERWDGSGYSQGLQASMRAAVTEALV